MGSSRACLGIVGSLCIGTGELLLALHVLVVLEPDLLVGREVPGLERYSAGFVSMASFALRSDMAPGEV
jgi:hypothetical protein